MNYLILLFLFLKYSSCLKEWWEDSKAVELNSTNFKATLGNNKFLIVKFYTKWCHYCKILAPTYDQLVEKVQEKNKTDLVTISRLEANSNNEIAMIYGIYSFPTIVMFDKSGKPVSLYEGSRTVPGLWFWLNRVLPAVKRNERKIIYKNNENLSLNQENKIIKLTDSKTNQKVLNQSHKLNLSLYENNTMKDSNFTNLIEHKIIKIKELISESEKIYTFLKDIRLKDKEDQRNNIKKVIYIFTSIVTILGIVLIYFFLKYSLNKGYTVKHEREN